MYTVQKLNNPFIELSISYRERFVYEYENTGDLLVELGSDQTSCHNPFLGGYYPVQVNHKYIGLLLSWSRHQNVHHLHLCFPTSILQKIYFRFYVYFRFHMKNQDP